MIERQRLLMVALVAATGCLGQGFVSPANAILTTDDVQDTLSDDCTTSGKFQSDPDRFTTRTITTASWKASALPLVGATVLFSGGVWLKRKRAEQSLAVRQGIQDVE